VTRQGNFGNDEWSCVDAMAAGELSRLGIAKDANAFIWIEPDPVLEAAREADARREGNLHNGLHTRAVDLAIGECADCPASSQCLHRTRAQPLWAGAQPWRIERRHRCSSRPWPGSRRQWQLCR